MRAVSVARRSAVKARTQAINQLRGLLVSAPQEVRERLLHAKTEECVGACARMRSLGKTTLLKSLTTTLRILAKRWLALGAEIKLLDGQLEHLTSDHAPRLRAEFGVGAQTAAVLVCVAGDNPERLRSEAALAALCGVSPLQASSGKTTRHRLNRGGDRAANNALWTIAMVRMRSDPRTQAYVARRTSQGLSRKEIQRCLKRYIVRELRACRRWAEPHLCLRACAQARGRRPARARTGGSLSPGLGRQGARSAPRVPSLAPTCRATLTQRVGLDLPASAWTPAAGETSARS